MIAAASLVAGFLGALMLYWGLWPESPWHAGMYPPRGRWYWLKRVLFAILFRLRARRKKQPRSAEGEGSSDQDSSGYGCGGDLFDMERCLPLPLHPHAMDSVYIGAYSSEGPNLTLRVARRPERRAEVWMVLQVPGVGCLQHPIHPDTAVTNTHPNTFSAGGLRFDVVDPMQTWRVSYSGQLRVGSSPWNNIEDKPERFLDTSFSLQWDAFAPAFNYDCDLDPALLGDAIAREKWSREYFDRLQGKHQTHYEQWGEVRGTLSIEGCPPQQLRLKAIRDHSFGVRKWTDFHRYIFCFLYFENGMTLQIGAVSQPGMLTHLKVGCLTYATGETDAVTWMDLNLWEVGEKELRPPAQFAFTFTAGGVRYELEVKVKMSALLYHEADRGGVVHETFCDASLSGSKGWGLGEFFFRNPERSLVNLEPTLPLLEEPSFDKVEGSQEELILPFTSLACSSSAFVGGKGSQLALLNRLSEKENFVVPAGLCITLKAFEKQLQENKSMQKLLETLASVAATRPLQLEAACKAASTALSQADVCHEVQTAVREGLARVFADQWEGRKMAVRSSAAGEDGSEASSAGQMETFLGLKGEAQIFEALVKCWASAFMYQAVEYRRQRGQPVLTSVGVVVQEMAPAEAAGVLFTAEPVTNNISLITINANFGLGEGLLRASVVTLGCMRISTENDSRMEEIFRHSSLHSDVISLSVVSGKSDPDTFTLRKGWDESLTVTERRSGSKKTKIIIHDGGGIAEVETPEADGCQLCLAEDAVLALARTGIQVEKYFGSPRDIEWAFGQGKIYLLQARPITTSELESEEELIHEFDSPLAGGYECLTTCNISEMMPDAVTPLTIFTFKCGIDRSMQLLSEGFGARQQVVPYRKALLSYGNHQFISLTDTSLLLLNVSLTKKEVMELSLLGETRPDLKIDSYRRYLGRPANGTITRIFNAVRMIKYLRKSTAITKYWERRLLDYRLGDGCLTAQELYADILLHIQDFQDVWHWGLVNSANSGSWSTVLLSIITKGSSDWTPEHFGDVALLLSQCQDVYSAEVPSAVQDLADQIIQDGLKETFRANTAEECVQLLNSNQYPVLQQKARTFLDRHGHRCVRETEMYEKSWSLDPSKLVTVLKTILETEGHRKGLKEKKSAQQLISEIKTPLSFSTRKILQYVLPYAWAAVSSREWGKNISVKMNDIFKTAYWKLAAMMVKEGRLPEEDVLFFLTQREIGLVLATRSARLVMKAQRRRRIFSKQMALRFPKISLGYPQPVDVKKKRLDESAIDGATTLMGMPVSQGIVKGPARIVLSLNDAHLIQAGDVLVVHCTDVGWSPYFAIIAGLVTEIGGLISHGAVVAREYGIPCVVNVTDATITIPSGSQVALDGRTGTVRVLSES